MATEEKRSGGPKFCILHWPPEILNTDPHAIFILLLVEGRLLARKEFINYAIDMRNLECAYEKYSPVCCYLGEREMQIIYDQAAFIHHNSTI